MGRIQISGQVFYNNMSPAAGVKVEIWELDLGPGGSNDLILSRTTNAQGRFSGLSKDWKDREGRVGFFDLPDVFNLEYRIKAEGKTYKGPFVWALGTSVPIVIGPPPKPVTKAKRDLVQVIHLSDGYTGHERTLYQFIEASSEGVAAALLGSKYRKIHVLKGNDATLAKFKSTLQAAANASGVAAVDVLFNTHGSTSKVYFKDGAKNASAVKTALSGLSSSVRGKLRALFSTACFGASHLDMWTDVGFSVACGSKGIYADSAASFAPMLTAWASETSFADAVQAANAADIGNTADNIAIAYYTATGQTSRADQIDSTRLVAGNGQIRIYSAP